MCGVFGFITRDGRGPDLVRLQRIAAETQLRGHHAFGLAWVDGLGAIHTFKRPGPATANLGDLDACQDAIAVIGHCRWATHGDLEDNRNNHPHSAGRGFFVHNGVVSNYNSLVYQYGLAPQTECDSEVLGMIMARSPGSLCQRAARMARAAQGTLAVLGLWRAPARLLVVRQGRPLYVGKTARGYYFGSLAGELPGSVVPIVGQYAGLLVFDGERLRHEHHRLEE